MIGTSFGAAWDRFKEDMGSWIVFSVVFMVIAGFAGSVVPIVGGLFFLPIAIREVTSAIQARRSPEISELWNFKHLGGDLISMLLYAVAQIVGIMMCFVGWPFAWIGFWYTAELAADDRVTATDGMKLSWAYARRNLGDTIGMALLSSILMTVGASAGLGIGVIFTMPIVLLAWSFYWLGVRDQVYELAHEQGIPVKNNAAPAMIATEQPVNIDLTPEGELAHFQQKLEGEDGDL